MSNFNFYRFYPAMKEIFSRLNLMIHTRTGALVMNMFMALAVMTVSRVIFMAWNWNRYEEYVDGDLLLSIFKGGLRFDLASLFYVNALWAVLFVVPVPFKFKAYGLIVKIVYAVMNAVALLANMCDTVYVGFTGRRTTATLFDEFSNEGNLGSVIGAELLHSWVLVLLFIVMVWGMWRLYVRPRVESGGWRTWLMSLCMLVLLVLCAIGAIRGGVDRTTRPITLSNANEYVNRPIEAAAVLNTPFSIIRSIGKPVFTVPGYMPADEAARLFPVIHHPADSVGEFKPMNVVVLIVESFSRGYIGALNREVNDSTYTGYTPCIDTLIERSLTYKHSYANGMKSIDGMPSVLSSIPMLQEPFFLTPAALNDVGSLASYLGEKGYESAFFHGAPNGSMGFEAFARHVGFDRYVGMDEYCMSPRHNGKDDFDGAWAIWDEPFLQFYAEELGKMKEPFVAGVFTASSHHPFRLPEEYVDSFPEDPIHPLLKCIRYTDMALGKFFETASTQQWYDNTLFVITSDHSMYPPARELATDLEIYASPVIFFAPGDPALRGVDYDRVAQQIDILPTVLEYLNYDRDYVAFGIDLFNTPPAETWAFSYNNGMYQFTCDGLFMQFDGERVRAVYDLEADPLLQNNMVDGTYRQDRVDVMEHKLKAFIQQYCTAMSTDNLVPRSEVGL